jgi:hypothetical protein
VRHGERLEGTVCARTKYWILRMVDRQFRLRSGVVGGLCPLLIYPSGRNCNDIAGGWIGIARGVGDLSSWVIVAG